MFRNNISTVEMLYYRLCFCWCIHRHSKWDKITKSRCVSDARPVSCAVFSVNSKRKSHISRYTITPVTSIQKVLLRHVLGYHLQCCCVYISAETTDRHYQITQAVESASVIRCLQVKQSISIDTLYLSVICILSISVAIIVSRRRQYMIISKATKNTQYSHTLGHRCH